MRRLPEDFADSLSRVIEPRDREAAAEIIEAATMLGDTGLRTFLALFSGRVRESSRPVRADELRTFLEQAAHGPRKRAR